MQNLQVMFILLDILWVKYYYIKLLNVMLYDKGIRYIDRYIHSCVHIHTHTNTHSKEGTFMTITILISVTCHVLLAGIYEYLLPPYSSFFFPPFFFFLLSKRLSSLWLFMRYDEPNLHFRIVWAISSLIYL